MLMGSPQNILWFGQARHFEHCCGSGPESGKGDRLLVMEAMKMQSTIYAPISGKIAKQLANIGDKVE